jgi:hypothetical protein
MYFEFAHNEIIAGECEKTTWVKIRKQSRVALTFLIRVLGDEILGVVDHPAGLFE